MIAGVRPEVLAYHKVGTPELGGTWCTRAQFRAHLQALGSAGVHCVDLVTFAQRVAGAAVAPASSRSTPEVLVTFDDAFAGFADHAWPELQAASVPVALFVPADFVGRRAGWDWPLPGRRAPHLGWSALRALAAAGVTIGAHGATHRDLRRLDDRTLDAELTGARRRLQDGVGCDVTAVAYPFGRADARVRAAAAAAGYTLGFSMCPPAREGFDPLAIRRHGVYAIDTARSVLDKADSRRRGHAMQERLERSINACAGIVARLQPG